MTWRVLRRLVIIDIMQTLEYRGAFFLYMVGLISTPVISLLVWLTVSAHSHGLPFHRQQFVTYYLLLTVTTMVTSVWLAPWLADSIRLGGLSPWLLRPVPYILNQIANNIGEKIVKLPLLLPLVVLMGFAFRADLRLPTDPLSWLLFAVCLPLSATVAFLLDFTLGSLAFWVHDVRGMVRVKYLLSGFLAGQLIPLALFPHSLQGLLRIQPFRYTLSFPLEVVTGTLTGAEVIQGFAWQIGYVVVLWALYRVEWHFGLRAYGASGDGASTA
jgi:viologen exporter family transport system permease protein